MNCPICKQRDEFVFDNNTKTWRCDRCHERFEIIPAQTNCDCAEEFKKIPKTNADHIRAMSDEELAKYLLFDFPFQYHEPIENVVKWLKQEADNELGGDT